MIPSGEAHNNMLMGEDVSEEELEAAISDEGKLAFARQVARYIVFLAENTGLVPCAVAEAANERLASYDSYEILVGDIAPA